MRYLLLAVSLLLAQPLQAEKQADSGENLYKSRCGLCHQLPEPEMLTAGQWRIVLETMQKRMGHIEMPPLSREERERILAYLARHARGR